MPVQKGIVYNEALTENIEEKYSILWMQIIWLFIPEMEGRREAFSPNGPYAWYPTRRNNRKEKNKKSSPERFELSRGNPMYLAGTRLNHSAKATC
uniref:Uncharacterized protein n=1 Tax=Solanum lycopersicum TaxID=4081 RepID=A0A3Q7FXK8_SOLLC